MINYKHLHYFWMVANVCWAVYDYNIGEPTQALLYVIFTALNFWGIYTWSRNAREAQPA